jgi:hypothetical protein
MGYSNTTMSMEKEGVDPDAVINRIPFYSRDLDGQLLQGVYSRHDGKHQTKDTKPSETKTI